MIEWQEQKLREKITMFQNSVDIIIFVFGMTGTAFKALMNMPLAWKVFRTRNTQSLSYWTQFLSIFASVLWITYASLMMVDGYIIDLTDPLIASLPLLICNIILITLNIYILTVKAINDHKAKKLVQENID